MYQEHQLFVLALSCLNPTFEYRFNISINLSGITSLRRRLSIKTAEGVKPTRLQIEWFSKELELSQSS
jgi:hypothetical protein